MKKQKKQIHYLGQTKPCLCGKTHERFVTITPTGPVVSIDTGWY